MIMRNLLLYKFNKTGFLKKTPLNFDDPTEQFQFTFTLVLLYNP